MATKLLFVKICLIMSIPTYALCSDNGFVCDDSSLRLVNVVFRHGHKTPTPSLSYPKNPNVNESYFPYGPGQVTNQGKQWMYSVGQALRRRYNNFLGNIYTPHEVYARSTYFDRTKVSLQLVLAGLYPPKGTALEWNQNFNWNPIPTIYDQVIALSVINYNKYTTLYEEYINHSEQGKEYFQNHKDFYDLVSKASGRPILTYRDVLLIYDSIVTEKEWGLEPPDWATEEVMEGFKLAWSDFWKTLTATPELRQLSGYLINKITKDMKLKMQKDLELNQKKIFLYSGHDVTLMYLLRSLNLEFQEYHRPPYGAFLIIELHEVHYIYGVKIFYQYYLCDNPVPMEIPGCDHFCPLEKFVELLKENIPGDDIYFL